METFIGNLIGLIIGLAVGGIFIWIAISLIEKRWK